MNQSPSSIMFSIDSKIRDSGLTGVAVGFFFLWALFTFGTWYNCRSQTNFILNEVNHEAELATQSKAAEIESLLKNSFHAVRTISRLPGIRAGEPYSRSSATEDLVKARRISVADYELSRRLFADLVSSVAISKLDVVYDGFRPDNDQLPFISFDSHSVRPLMHLAKSDSANAQMSRVNRTDLIESVGDADTHGEYAEYVRQLAYFRKHQASVTESALDRVAPINSGLIPTSDNLQYKSSLPSDKRNLMGLSFSVPIYDANSHQFKGIVSTVLRANVLEAALIGLPFVPVSKEEKQQLQGSNNALRFSRSANFLLEETLTGVRIFDRRNAHWVMELEKQDAPAFEYQVKLDLPGQHTWVLHNYVPQSVVDHKITVTRSNALVQFALLSFALALVWATLRAMMKQQAEATKRHLELAGELGKASDEHAKTRLKLQATLDTIADLFFEVGPDGRYYDIYSRSQSLLAMPVESYVGKTINDTLPPDVASLWLTALSEANAQGVSTGKQYQLSLPQGNRWFELSVSRKTTQPSEEPRFILLAHDITARREAEEGLRQRETFFRLISENVGDYISVVNLDGKNVYTSPAYERFVGNRVKLRGGDAFELIHPDDQDRVRKTFAATVSTGDQLEVEYRHVCADGSSHPMECQGTVIRNGKGDIDSVVLVSRDITERKAKDVEIENLAFYDSLTNLPNRRLLLDRLRQALARLARTDSNGALMFIDLDNFKGLNDTLGHAVGDILLQQVAARLLLCVRENDTVARLGGDEFVVMLEDLDKEPVDAASKAELIAEKIHATLNKPYLLGDYEHTSTPSIGVTLYGKQAEDMDEILKRADLAMYQAKTAGRNAIRFFDAEMRARVLAQIALEADIRDGLNKDQFLLYYQAQIGTDGRISGAEALIRWQHPIRGLILPAEFVSLAEDSGLILPLGNVIMEIACRQLAAWASEPSMRDLSLAVNVSARQFLSVNFVGQVLGIIKQTGANPAHLKLELTESLFVSNVDEIIAKMSALRRIGVKFSLDDFGTGYSSLSYLKRLPLDQLKIDQSFVRDLLTDANDVAIARTIVGLAESLGLSVIAEGVETEGQRECLAQQGCHAYQGFLFSKPLSIDGFENLVRQKD